MSYSTIAPAVVTRLLTVTNIGPCRQYEAYFQGEVESPTFRSLYMTGPDANGKYTFNSWWFTRMSKRRKKSQDDDSSYILQHEIRMVGIYSLARDSSGTDSDTPFQAIVDGVDAAFGAVGADRTLGGVLLTHSEPDPSDIIIAKLYDGLFEVHHCTMDLTLEEIEGSTDSMAPTISAVSPAAAATGVSRSTAITWTISKALAPASVSPATVLLFADVAETAVAGTVALTNNGSSTTITFTPSAPLAATTLYQAVLTTGVLSQAGGVGLALPYCSRFTTGA